MLGRIAQRLALNAGIPVVSSYHTDFSRYTEAYGVGWLRPSVSRYLAEFHRRSRRVYTPSHVARADLAAIGVHDVEVWGRGVDTRHFSPVRRSEAFPSRGVTTGARSSGLPIIAVPAGGVADHLRDDVNGVACAAEDPGDMAAAIVRLALDRARTRRLGAGARLTAEALDWSIELDALDRSYREITFSALPLGAAG